MVITVKNNVRQTAKTMSVTYRTERALGVRRDILTHTVTQVGSKLKKNNLYVDINILCDVSESEYRINSLSSKSNFLCMCKCSF